MQNDADRGSTTDDNERALAAESYCRDFSCKLRKTIWYTFDSTCINNQPVGTLDTGDRDIQTSHERPLDGMYHDTSYFVHNRVICKRAPNLCPIYCDLLFVFSCVVLVGVVPVTVGSSDLFITATSQIPYTGSK